MNPNDSVLSTVSNASPGTTAMARVVANVVDMQQQLVSQYQAVVNALEALKTCCNKIDISLHSLNAEVHDSIKSMKEELRRTDDRAQKQVDDLRATVGDLRATHAKEVERLMDLMKTLLIREGSTQTVHAEPQRTTAAQIYSNAAPPNNYGASTNPLGDFAAQAQAHYAACYLHQLQEQQRLRSIGLSGAAYFANHQGVMNNMGHPGAFPQGPQNAPLFAASVPKLSDDASNLPPVPVSTQSSNIAAMSLPSSVPHIGTSLTTTVSTSAPLVTPPAPVFSTPSLSSATQPPKAEPPKINQTVKSDVIPSKPPFSFITPKSEAVITAADSTKPVNVFSEIKPTQNVFSKSPEVKPTVKQESGDFHDEGDHDHVEEFEPQIDFKPVCPLPELVKVVTGEENEKVLFEERCKLYRYADETNEWKERGTGVMKVLENTENKKCRVVMRREQVHKVCANHQLLPGMTIQAMPRQEKAMMWYCEDFSEEQKSHEKLSARFASVEVANKFKEIFESAVKVSDDSSIAKSLQVDKPGNEASEKDGSAKEKNDTKKVEGVDVEISLKDENFPATELKGYGDQFKLQPGQWECPECYSRSAAEKCPCCGTSRSTGKTGDAAPKSVFPTSTIPLGALKTTEGSIPKFTFGISAAAAAKDSPPTSVSAVTKSPLFGASLTSTTTSTGALSFGTKPSIFGGAASKPTAEASSTLPSFTLSKKPDASVSAFSAAVTTSATGSSNSSASTATSVFGGSRLFGTSKVVDERKEAEKEEKNKAEPAKSEQKVFGGGLVGSKSFADHIKSGVSIFDAAYTQKAQAEFAAQAKSKLAVTDKKDPVSTSSSASKVDSKDGEAESGADEEFEPNVDFAPAIPLPDLVDVITGEEGEQVVFTARAKLYRFIKETKENKERGVGDLKILRNPKTNAHRVVMRRDHVHKVCANFAILPSIELNERKGVQHAFNWICRDYSESREGTDEIFTVKFKTAEIAKEFHDRFLEAAAAHVTDSK
ncbi:Nuclear pore complex protein Nup98-Nup96 [Parelaphostrongylus tenuis]|uniref:Nuclear pore complex protein Nup98-Nup96 n=1 Tax=Parelaphostrongylus tenuis TaxID=148309 RepID=A0AAD5WIT9_PARTN|nr:Nuclear pore complex protein Nup98-Nup96 [Parelaphostrongylus tenuis]